MLTSHSRCHGAPPTEPWHFSSVFMDDFRRAVEMKYRLMPYVWAQARISSENGWPLLRPLFFAYPDDPGSWLIEDEYLFGADLLVAPLMEETGERPVYLPPGQWIDYQDGRVYSGECWQVIKAGVVPCIILAREGSVIPHAALAQSCDDIDWSHLSLTVFSSAATEAVGEVSLPAESVVHRVVLRRDGNGFEILSDPLKGRVVWDIEKKSIC
jgi:alpha-D-xyloside xylohydrolase